MEKLNIGLIGYKFMGKTHSNAWRQVGRFFDVPFQPVLHTICGRNQEAAQEAATQLGWENVATDWKNVIANPDIHLVDVSTANDTHAEISIAALEAGKHVLCEKPLAMTVEEAQRMTDAAAKSGKIAMVCHNYRRIPAIALAKKMIANGDLGRLFHYRARYLQDWIVDPEFPLAWRLRSDVAGSGTHGDINAHIIDLGRYLVGEFTEVCGTMETFIKERPLPADEAGGLSGAGSSEMGEVTVDDAVVTMGRMEGGVLACLEATRFALGRKNHIQLEINGSKGSLVFDFEDMNRLKYFNNDDPADRMGYRDILVTEDVHEYANAWWPAGHIIGYEHTFTHTFADVLRAVAKGQSDQPNFQDGLQNQKVLEAVQQSANERKWVSVA